VWFLRKRRKNGAATVGQNQHIDKGEKKKENVFCG
jgi:hypothetical protein